MSKRKEAYKNLSKAKLQAFCTALKDAISGNYVNLFITFATAKVGVVIPEDLKLQYPDQMSIILHNKFNNLKVLDDGFEVGLSFSGKEHNLKIPFAALLYFLDKDCGFQLRFDPDELSNASSNLQNKEDAKRAKVIDISKLIKKNQD